MANERKCLCCGTSYVFCSHCPSGKNEPTWKNIYDTEECKKVFEICSAYVNKQMTKGDAVIKLKSFKLPNHLIDKYQKIVDEIMYVEKSTVKQRKPRRVIQKEVVNDDL